MNKYNIGDEVSFDYTSIVNGKLFWRGTGIIVNFINYRTSTWYIIEWITLQSDINIGKSGYVEIPEYDITPLTRPDLYLERKLDLIL